MKAETRRTLQIAGIVFAVLIVVAGVCVAVLVR